MIKAIVPSTNLAMRAHKNEADSTLKQINALGFLDRDRKILERGDFIEIPIRKSISGSQVIEQQDPEFYRRNPKLVETLEAEMSPEELSLLPRGWCILGDVIVVKIHPRLTSFQARIGQALLSLYPRCRTILRDFGIVGQFREPMRKIIAGGITETIHRENGVVFKLDACKVMFSAGNLRERMRMSCLGKNDFIIDMFAGIGYFALPMAVHSRPRKVLAIELNPLAYDYLCQNIKLNRVQEIVQPVLGDCAKKTPLGVADRVIMGMVQVTDRYLRKGIEALRPDGILHYHQTIPSWQYPAAAINDVIEAAAAIGCRAEIVNCIKVKKYSPGVVHVVVDARIGKDF